MKKLVKSLLLAASLGVLSLGQAHADLASDHLWANGQSYAMFTLGTFVGPNLGASSILDGPANGQSYSVMGDIGVGSNNQTMMTDAASPLDGNIYLYPGSTLTGTQTYVGTNSGPPSQPSAGPHRTIAGNSSVMTQQENNIIAGYNYFKSMTTNQGTVTSTNNVGGASGNRLFNPATMSNLVLSGNSITLSGTGQIVINLQTFSLSNATLDLVGNSTTSFLFNVNSNFSLFKSQININTGGSTLTAGNVFFNLVGASPSSAAEGSSGYYSLSNSTLTGNVLAPYRTIELTNNSVINGTAVGDRVVLDNSTIIQTPASN